MKSQKLISLDIEILTDLKSEPNFSALCNKLLKEYIASKNFNSMPLDKREKLVKKAKIQREAMKAMEAIDAE